jgi:hypothetical protein
MQQGLLGRISRSSVLEYHAFGIISEGRNARCHYMICGVQGESDYDTARESSAHSPNDRRLHEKPCAEPTENHLDTRA